MTSGKMSHGAVCHQVASPRSTPPPIERNFRQDFFAIVWAEEVLDNLIARCLGQILSVPFRQPLHSVTAPYGDVKYIEQCRDTLQKVTQSYTRDNEGACRNPRRPFRSASYTWLFLRCWFWDAPSWRCGGFDLAPALTGWPCGRS